MELHDALRRHFGFSDFRPGQEVAIRHVLAGRDTLVVMPTGAGKSLIYQFSALLLPGTTLVISPLVALMKDQVDGLTRRGLPATTIHSGLDPGERAARLRALADGRYRIVLVAPERLRSQPFRDALARAELSLLVVDEAHCLSQWGHDFRPDYLHLAAARLAWGSPVTLALTATATPAVQDEIVRLLGLPAAERLVAGFNRPNLAFEVRSAADTEAKLRLLRDLLGELDGAGLAYVGTRRDAEEVAEFVREAAGRQARPYHGWMDSAERTAVQDAFLAGELPIVVATNAFGMGIDRPDVRWVLHYDLPGTLEAYYQEAGRAGRDGQPARAVLLYSPRDTALQQFFIDTGVPSIDELRAVHDFLRLMPRLRLDDIERATGLPATKTRVALEQLELAGGLRRGPDDPSGRFPVEVSPLADAALQAVVSQVEARRAHRRRQLEQMVAYAETSACRRRRLLDHFSDPTAAEAAHCCDNCLARAAADACGPRRAETRAEFAPLIVLDTVRRLPWGVGREKLAQILKGSRAKDVARYREVRTFARFSELRQTQIESLVDQLLRSGYLQQVGGQRPVVRLTAAGQVALDHRAAITVELVLKPTPTSPPTTLPREDTTTTAATAELLDAGLAPEQIATARGLALGTIYAHLAALVAEGRLTTDAIIPPALRKSIRVAIEAVGATDRLAPIKAALPDAVDYGLIRCEVEAWKRELATTTHVAVAHQTPAQGGPLASTRHPQGSQQAARIHLIRISGSTEGIPELIAALDDPDTNVRRLAASALGKLQAEAGVEPLLHLLAREKKPQVRQYALVALGRIGDPRAWSALEQVGADPTELYYNRLAANVALGKLRQHRSSAPPRAPDACSEFADPVAAFLARPRPRPLQGPWLAGWALDFHSRFEGDRHRYSATGSLVLRYKYRGELHLADELAKRWAELLDSQPTLPRPDGVVGVPPSIIRPSDPVTLLVRALSARLGVAALANALVKTRATRPQKELTSLAQKRANVAGAFALTDEIRERHLLLVDDLYDSGATLSEIATVLRRGGVASLVVLTLTRTIHADA